MAFVVRRKRRFQRRKKVRWELDPETAREAAALLLILFGALFLLSLFGLAGSFGHFLVDLLCLLFGFLAYLFAAAMVVLGVVLLLPNKYEVGPSSIIGLVLFFLFFPGFVHLFFGQSEALDIAKEGRGGGLIGFSTSVLFNSLMGFWATFLLLFFGTVVSLMVTFSLKISNVFIKIKGLFGHLRGAGYEVKSNVPVLSMTDKRAELQNRVAPGEYQLPPMDILEDPSGSPQGGDINKNVAIISKTLSQFGITVTMSDATIGPTVTQYTLKPAEGVKLSQITARSNDLALALAAHAIRIEAPIPGKSLVGIEVPNQKRAIVTLKEVLLSSEWKGLKANLPVALGRDVAATPMAVALEKMPHLLVAGSTGSGKSIFLNALILGMLYTKKPDELKFILIDPKRVEFSNYNGLPHLLVPVVTDLDKTVSTLKWIVSEMERRYKLFQEAKKRDIESYNVGKKEDKVPYVIVIIDELADLMVLSASEVESSIVRIAQMARATGIHLVVATQRPSVDVITGLIKANITSRIAFAVASQVDSRTILDMAGAEKLIGAGDMLYQSSDIAKARRVQAPMIREQEVHKVVDFIKAQTPEVQYQEEITEYKAESKGLGEIPKDEMYEQAMETVANSGKASASLLQRRLRIGYTRAARLLDLLEQNGVIGPADGAKPRDVLNAKPSMPGQEEKE